MKTLVLVLTWNDEDSYDSGVNITRVFPNGSTSTSCGVPPTKADAVEIVARDVKFALGLSRD